MPHAFVRYTVFAFTVYVKYYNNNFKIRKHLLLVILRFVNNTIVLVQQGDIFPVFVL